MERQGFPGGAVGVRFKAMSRRSSSRSTPVSERFVAQRPARLSARQREVAALIAQGLLNREISVTLQISERTVESHVEAILRRLGFRRRTQIAIWVVRRALRSNT